METNMQYSPLIAWLYWDPPLVAFTIPFLDRPVFWYGICFVSGFIMGYFILVPMLKRLLWQSRYPRFASEHNAPAGPERSSWEKMRSEAATKIQALSVSYADRITWFIVIGTIVGARIGHVLFYDWPYFSHHPEHIVKIWEGGLASHGGTIGVLISILLFLYWHRKEIPELSFISLIDIVAVPTALVACCIRIGNLFNQEILGYPSQLPWAIAFGHPADGSAPLPRHPVALYEAIAYLATFIMLYSLWKFRGRSLKVGTLSGLFFLLVFGGRFFIDFLKLPQSGVIDESFLQMGQYLSIPFVVLGIILVAVPSRILQRKPVRFIE